MNGARKTLSGLMLVARALPRGRFERIAEFKDLEDRVAPLLRPAGPGGASIELSRVFRTPEDLEAGGLLYLDMTEDARVLYDPEGVLTGFLERFRGRRFRARPGPRRHRPAPRASLKNDPPHG